MDSLNWRQENQVRKIAGEELDSRMKDDFFTRLLKQMHLQNTIHAETDAYMNKVLPDKVSYQVRDECDRRIPQMVSSQMTTLFPAWLRESGQVQKAVEDCITGIRQVAEQKLRQSEVELERVGKKVVAEMAKEKEFNPIYEAVTAHASQVATDCVALVGKKHEDLLDEREAKFQNDLAESRQQRDQLVGELTKYINSQEQLQKQVTRSNWISGFSMVFGTGALVLSWMSR